MTKPEHRRRRFVIDRKFQFGMSLHIIGFVYLYLVLFALLANFNALRMVISGSTDDALYIESVTRLQIFLEVFIVPLIFTFICMCLHGVLFSHRIAGPIYRFKETLKRVRAGNFSTPIQIRENDYFQDLCDEVNELVSRLRSDLLSFREMSTELADAGEELVNAGDLSPATQEKMLTIANASTKLRQFFENYTLDGPSCAPTTDEVEPVAAEEPAVEQV